MTLGGLAGFEAEIDDKVLLAPLPSDLDELIAHPLAAEKLMPVLGLVRSPRSSTRSRPPRPSPSTAGSVTPRRSTPPTTT